MDRISAIRNVEDALREFEAGETDLAGVERRVLTVLRTYATEFEDRDDVAAYRVDPVDAEELVVVAPSDEAARARAGRLLDRDETGSLSVDRIG